MTGVSLTFDDALPQHLDVAMPVLEEHGLVGTFYTHVSAPGFLSRWGEWQAAAGRGQEVGNHTVFHPAESWKPWVRPGNAIEAYSLDRMRQELAVASDVLKTLDGLEERTFAYPCSNSRIGGAGFPRRLLRAMKLDRTRIAGWVDRFRLDFGATYQSYEPVVRDLFTAARAGGLELGSTVPPVEDWNRWAMPSVAVDGWTFLDLTAWVDTAVSRGTWAILQFHGVGGGHRMDCDAVVFREFIAWLAAEHPGMVVTIREGARRAFQASGGRKPTVSSMTEHASNASTTG